MKMISLNQIRQQCNTAHGLPDAQLEILRDQLYGLANLAVEAFKDNRLGAKAEVNPFLRLFPEYLETLNKGFSVVVTFDKNKPCSEEVRRLFAGLNITLRERAPDFCISFVRWCRGDFNCKTQIPPPPGKPLSQEVIQCRAE